jgi:glutamate racemase
MIGVFDSGYGGLSILKYLVEKLPQYRYVYLGDNARAPYGDRSSEVVYEYTEQAVAFLEKKGCRLIIIACNTSSAEALRKIQQRLVAEGSPTKVLGVIVPSAEEAVLKTKNGHIGVLATDGTVRAGTFVREIQNRNPDVVVYQQAAPLLVPFIEAGEHDSAAAHAALKVYLTPLLEAGIDTLILGCTHYAHIANQVRELVGKGVLVITEGPIVAEKLAEYLARHPELEASISKNGGIDFFTTDSSERFEKLGTFFYGNPIVSKNVDIV